MTNNRLGTGGGISDAVLDLAGRPCKERIALAEARGAVADARIAALSQGMSRVAAGRLVEEREPLGALPDLTGDAREAVVASAGVRGVRAVAVFAHVLACHEAAGHLSQHIAAVAAVTLVALTMKIIK